MRPCCWPHPPRERHAPQLFGAHIDRRPDGSIAFTGQDPRISWELDYAEAYWITHSIAGELMVSLEKLQHPSLSDDEARIQSARLVGRADLRRRPPQTRRDG